MNKLKALQSKYDSLKESSHDIMIEKVLAQESQRETEKLMLTISEKSPNSHLSIINKNLTFNFCSGLEFKKQNIDTALFVNLHLEDVFGTHADIMRENCLKTFEGEELSFELFIDNKNMLYRTVPLFPETGEISQILIVAENITERKQAEKVLIENQRLSAIGEMASSIAHDFNNTLQSIYGNLELAMQKSDVSESTLKYLKAIKTAASDAAERVQVLQRFGRKKQAKSKFSNLCANTLIDEVIIQARPMWKDQAEKNGLSIKIETEFGKIPKIFGKEGELRSALYNMIKNSIEAMPGGGNIFIKTGKRAKNIFISISDTGIGMDEETKVRLFQPFYSTKGYDIGRGLGMSGVYSIVNEHGGSVCIKRTEPGQGTTMEILFPVSKTEKSKEAIAKVVDPINSLNILWVEDDEIIRGNVGEILELLGHNGDIAKSGKEALKYLENKNYDIVITDIGMPEMSGWQLSDIINERYKGKINIAVSSGWGLEVDNVKTKKHGVKYVLGKPFNIDQLKKLLTEVSGSK